MRKEKSSIQQIDQQFQMSPSENTSTGPSLAGIINGSGLPDHNSRMSPVDIKNQIEETVKRLYSYGESFRGIPDQDTKVYAWSRFSLRASRIITQQQRYIQYLEEKLDEVGAQNV